MAQDDAQTHPWSLNPNEHRMVSDNLQVEKSKDPFGSLEHEGHGYNALVDISDRLHKTEAVENRPWTADATTRVKTLSRPQLEVRVASSTSTKDFAEKHNHKFEKADEIERPRTSINGPRIDDLDTGSVIPFRIHQPRGRGRSILAELDLPMSPRLRARTHSDTDRRKYHPITGALLGVERDGAAYVPERIPPGDLTLDFENESAVSDTSEVHLAASVPSSFAMESMAISPKTKLSPTIFPSMPEYDGFPSRTGRGSQRSKSYYVNSVAKGRRGTRNSLRSPASVKSPASSFLSQWNKETAAADEPVEEVQVIGDNNEYIVGRQIGFGGFSVVKEVSAIENDAEAKRAVKVVRRHIPGKTEEENERLQTELEHEVLIWRQLSHPNVLRLVSVFANIHATFCIMDLNVGGTLFDLVKRYRNSSFASKSAVDRNGNIIVEPRGIPFLQAKQYLHQLALAVRYLHQDMGMVHRDIKLENCLLDMTQTSPEGHALLRLCDFGMADFIASKEREDILINHEIDDGWNELERMPSSTAEDCNEANPSIVGSLPYCSPELIKSATPLYEEATDMWAYGVVAHACLAGELPFSHPFLPRLRMTILRGEWNTDNFKRAVELQPDCTKKDADMALYTVARCLRMKTRTRWNILKVLDSELLGGCDSLNMT